MAMGARPRAGKNNRATMAAAVTTTAAATEARVNPDMKALRAAAAIA